ncbi:hypothetical protein OF001_U60111 [Pseudomonas sp. OF001]|nr:hypothetical protein OF001_U60111 [Pseudomonas sp. OF001]
MSLDDHQHRAGLAAHRGGGRLQRLQAAQHLAATVEAGVLASRQRHRRQTVAHLEALAAAGQGQGHRQAQVRQIMGRDRQTAVQRPLVGQIDQRRDVGQAAAGLVQIEQGLRRRRQGRGQPPDLPAQDAEALLHAPAALGVEGGAQLDQTMLQAGRRQPVVQPVEGEGDGLEAEFGGSIETENWHQHGGSSDGDWRRDDALWSCPGQAVSSGSIWRISKHYPCQTAFSLQIKVIAEALAASAAAQCDKTKQVSQWRPQRTAKDRSRFD